MASSKSDRTRRPTAKRRNSGQKQAPKKIKKGLETIKATKGSKTAKKVKEMDEEVDEPIEVKSSPPLPEPVAFRMQWMVLKKGIRLAAKVVDASSEESN